MSLRQRPFQQVDVFTAVPYLGNPLAVVLDGADLSDAQMQQFAQWTQLSETTFVLPPSLAAAAQGADYRVRIFTPTQELPFAGHPTLGTCHAWLAAGGQPTNAQTVVQECAAGLITLRREGHRLAFAAPALTRSTPAPGLLQAVAGALGLNTAQIVAAQELDNGPHWLGLLLDSPDTVLALTPDHAALKQLGHAVGVVSVVQAPVAAPLIGRSNREARASGAHRTALAPEDTGAEVEVRAFAAALGVNEDPVTGSLNAALAQWLIADGHAPARYTASQGRSLERDGQIEITQDAQGQVWVGGDCVSCVSGHVLL